MSNQFKELQERIEFLENKLNEANSTMLSIRRDASTTAPTSMEVGSVRLSDDGSNQRMYWQSPTGLVYFDGTSA